MATHRYRGAFTDAAGQTHGIDVKVIGNHPNIEGWLKDHVYKGAQEVKVVKVDRAGKPIGAAKGQPVKAAPIQLDEAGNLITSAKASPTEAAAVAAVSAGQGKPHAITAPPPGAKPADAANTAQ